MIRPGICMGMSLMPGLAMGKLTLVHHNVKSCVDCNDLGRSRRTNMTLDYSSNAPNISGLTSNINQEDNLGVSIIWMVGLSIAVGVMCLSFLLMHWYFRSNNQGDTGLINYHRDQQSRMITAISY